MTALAITKKAFVLLTLYSLLNVLLTLNLYARDSLPTIKNDTPWKVKFDYDWLGCGASNKYKHKTDKNDPFFAPVEHYTDKKISSHKQFTLKVGCFSRPGITVKIAPYSLSNAFLYDLPILLVNGNIIACTPATCVCKSELCKEIGGYWHVPRDKVLPTLKYDSSKKNKYNGYSGYYWYMDTHQ